MTSRPNLTSAARVKLRLGHWFEAEASGWGVAALPVLLVVLVVAAGLGIVLKAG